MEIFEETDYRTALRHELEAHKGQRGYQRRLAEAIGCHTSMISQVLRGDVHLNLDHAARLARFCGLGDDETEYLILLVAHDRSGSRALRSFLTAKLETLRTKNRRLEKQLRAQQQVSAEHQLRYYGDWAHSAVHILLTVPQYRDPAAIARKLGLSTTFVQRILNDLNAMSLAHRDKGVWLPAATEVHLPGTSPLHAHHHASWRAKAVAALHEGDERSLYYTAVHTLSRADLEAVKRVLVGAIKRTREIVNPSPEEELACLQIDFFPVGVE